MSAISSDIGKDKSKIVFVSNIPHEATEQHLIEVFRTIGRVIAFKLVRDKESGRPVGQAYCEYKDFESAQSAIRNLNNHVIGGKSLTVIALDTAFSERNASGTLGVRTTNINSIASGAMTPDQITHILEGMSPQQLVDLLAEYKSFIVNNPEAARQLLIDSPQLSASLMQILIMFGYLTTAQVQQFQAVHSASMQAPQQQHMQQQQQQQQNNIQQNNNQNQQNYSSQYSMANVEQAKNIYSQLPEQQKLSLINAMQIPQEQLESLPQAGSLVPLVLALKEAVKQGFKLQ